MMHCCFTNFTFWQHQEDSAFFAVCQHLIKKIVLIIIPSVLCFGIHNVEKCFELISYKRCSFGKTYKKQVRLSQTCHLRGVCKTLSDCAVEDAQIILLCKLMQNNLQVLIWWNLRGSCVGKHSSLFIYQECSKSVFPTRLCLDAM